MVNDEPSVKEMVGLWNLVVDFVQFHDITCAESIYQRDSVQEALANFVESICDKVGYNDFD